MGKKNMGGKWLHMLITKSKTKTPLSYSLNSKTGHKLQKNKTQIKSLHK